LLSLVRGHAAEFDGLGDSYRRCRIVPRRRSASTLAGVDGRVSLDELLAQARAGLDRVAPHDLLVEQCAGALVVDIRPVQQRDQDGAIAGAVVIDRNVLEWRLDPASPYRIGEVTGYDQRIVLVCNEGYASSLAAATLRGIGLHRATDLIGGFQALRAAAEFHTAGVSDLPAQSR
jgi:rhodanese-related sulfurtransferase